MATFAGAVNDVLLLTVGTETIEYTVTAISDTANFMKLLRADRPHDPEVWYEFDSVVVADTVTPAE